MRILRLRFAPLRMTKTGRLRRRGGHWPPAKAFPLRGRWPEGPDEVVLRQVVPSLKVGMPPAAPFLVPARKGGKEPARAGKDSESLSPPWTHPSFKRPKGVIPLLDIPEKSFSWFLSSISAYLPRRFFIKIRSTFVNHLTLQSV